jgi:hypothetical protein
VLGVVHKVESLLLSAAGECGLFFDLAKSEYRFCSNLVFPSQIQNTIAFLHNKQVQKKVQLSSILDCSKIICGKTYSSDYELKMTNQALITYKVILIKKDSSVETATTENKMNPLTVVPNQDSKSPIYIKQCTSSSKQEAQ